LVPQSVKDLPDKFDRLAQSWNTANNATQLSDFGVCMTWGVKSTFRRVEVIAGVARRRRRPAG
jgi:phage terminase large subunit-like protein